MNLISKSPYKLFLFVTGLLFTSVISYSQNADSLFKVARIAAFDNKDNAKAIQLSKQALLSSPRYADVEVFLARLYAWEKQYDSSRMHFENVLGYDWLNKEAYAGYTDLEIWNNHLNNAVEIANKGLSHYPSDEVLLMKKARILSDQKHYPEAALVASQVLTLNRKNTDAIALSSALRNYVAVNKISAAYDFIRFDKQFDQPWHLATIAYTRQSSFGPITANFNYANRFGKNGWQGEVDAYPNISKTFYGYLSFGYSPNEGVFPKYRAGASLYANLPKNFESEAGVRYLNFGTSTYIYTGYIGKYVHNWLFGARAFVTPASDGGSQTYIVNGRYFFGGADDFVGLSLGSGISPDDRVLNVQFGDKNRLKSEQATLNFSHTLKGLNVITAKAAWFYQEYKAGSKGNQIDIGIGFQHKF